jgi:hypothetical protein
MDRSLWERVKKSFHSVLSQRILNLLTSFKFVNKKIYYYVCNIVALFVTIIIKEVYANPIGPEPIEDPGLRISILTLLFVVGIFVEYSLLKFENEKIQFRKQEFFIPVLKINLLTFPLTQILAYVVYLYLVSFFWLYVLIFEITVVLIEWQLLKIILHKQNDQIASNKILIQMIKVNFVSFPIILEGKNISIYLKE